MKVTLNSIDCFFEALKDAATEIKQECEPEDYESNEDMIESMLNNVRHNFEDHMKDT